MWSHMEKIEFPRYEWKRPKNIPWIHLPGDPNREQRRQMERNGKRKKRERYRSEDPNHG